VFPQPGVPVGLTGMQIVQGFIQLVDLAVEPDGLGCNDLVVRSLRLDLSVSPFVRASALAGIEHQVIVLHRKMGFDEGGLR
jgi:hypothetical protein